ncbi:hypothetical protein GCM10010156_05120 [Planobispora rosea]|uniref:DUF11 domain-containing protein n=1 Tax=Planobispora rosea TaxID=35762 RepID=A0A8J3S0R7_PLARO|nr:DUF11 domain-containing protein [Planobispora rosea]GGS49410.1 hypothetical protein GCM10010156_05120 [Planobispora rosea]GIH83796.1 hypothetical protein Pro02_22040 [Planobispora rosea]
MSHFATRLTAAAAAVVLGGALLAQSPAAAAATAPAVVAPAAATAAPQFKAVVYYQKHIRRGGYTTYKIKVTNKGYEGQAYALLAGSFPAGTRKIKVISKPRSITCGVEDRAFGCWIASLDNGDTTTMTVRAWLSPSKRGTYTAQFGVSYADSPDADVDELIDEMRFTKFKSKVV